MGLTRHEFCYCYCYICLCDRISLHPLIFSYKTEVWLLGTEIVKIRVINCSAQMGGYSHCVSKYSIYF